MVSYSKLFGLKKLRLLAKGNPNAFVSPFKVYSSLNQIRKSHFRGMPRLLVRMDEKGKRYALLTWGAMPRKDLKANEINSHIDNLQLQSMKFPERYRKRIRYLIHPTRNRSEIAWTGRISVSNTRYFKYSKLDFKNSNLVLTSAPSPANEIHRNLNEYNLKISLSDKGFQYNCSPLSKLDPLKKQQATSIANTLCNLFTNGIKTNQIKLGRYYTSISFLSWKDAPTILELYDLAEERYKPPPKGPRF